MHFWVCRSLENFESLNNRANMAGRKRKIMTLQERVKVVDRLEKGESARMIATSLAVGKTQIQAIASDKVEIKRSCMLMHCTFHTHTHTCFQNMLCSVKSNPS